MLVLPISYVSELLDMIEPRRRAERLWLRRYFPTLAIYLA